jgi:hypothetical protein
MGRLMNVEVQGRQLSMAGVAQQWHMGWGLASKSKSIKDGWEVGSSCRIGFLGELTGVGAFPNMASIVGWSVGASWINGHSQEGGSSTKVCHIKT